MYSITDTHDSAETFDNTATFDPSRWQRKRTCHPYDVATASTNTAECGHQGANDHSDHNDHSQHSTRFEYIPFGGGSKRYCVGQSLARLILAVFVVELARTAPDGWKLVNGVPAIRTAPVPLPVDDLPIVLR